MVMLPRSAGPGRGLAEPAYWRLTRPRRCWPLSIADSPPPWEIYEVLLDGQGSGADDVAMTISCDPSPMEPFALTGIVVLLFRE